MMVLVNTLVGIILQCMCPKSTHLFTLTTHNVICLLYLTKAEKKKKKRGNCFNLTQIVRHWWEGYLSSFTIRAKNIYECHSIKNLTFSSVQVSHSVLHNSLQPHGLQNARLPCPSPIPGACSNSCPSSQWCHPTISSSIVPFSSCPQSFPASGSFPMSQFFTSGGQSIVVSASASVLPMNNRDWSPLGWTGWISLQSKGLSRVFFNNTVQKHQFFSAQPSL